MFLFGAYQVSSNIHKYFILSSHIFCSHLSPMKCFCLIDLYNLPHLCKYILKLTQSVSVSNASAYEVFSDIHKYFRMSSYICSITDMIIHSYLVGERGTHHDKCLGVSHTPRWCVIHAADWVKLSNKYEFHFMLYMKISFTNNLP